MSPYTAWPPDDTPPSHLSRQRGNPLLYSWWRVAAEDGSTVAFTPDEATARFIASSLTASSAQYGLPLAGVGG